MQIISLNCNNIIKYLHCLRKALGVDSGDIMWPLRVLQERLLNPMRFFFFWKVSEKWCKINNLGSWSHGFRFLWLFLVPLCVWETNSLYSRERSFRNTGKTSYPDGLQEGSKSSAVGCFSAENTDWFCFCAHSQQTLNIYTQKPSQVHDGIDVRLLPWRYSWCKDLLRVSVRWPADTNGVIAFLFVRNLTL